MVGHPPARPATADALAIEDSAALLVAGELVAFPTETVYGLGANAADAGAVARLYALKGRPALHPVIVHLAAGADPLAWAAALPHAAHTLMARFWPGPLTLVLQRRADVGVAPSGGQDSIGLRCPAHPVAQALLGAFARRIADGGVAAPSANRFGRISPTTAQHVRDEFGAAVAVLEGGTTEVGIESTIIDLSRWESAGPVLLRPGAITCDQLAEALGRVPAPPDGAAPRAAGMLERHYAPATPLRLVEKADLHDAPDAYAVWSYSLPASPARRRWRTAPAEPAAYAREMYATLRRLDASGALEIWVERPPATAAWAAVNDRLERAAAGRRGTGVEPGP